MSEFHAIDTYYHIPLIIYYRDQNENSKLMTKRRPLLLFELAVSLFLLRKKEMF